MSVRIWKCVCVRERERERVWMDNLHVGVYFDIAV